ncbi:hypothetical protein CLV72_1011161 [Allonocardiopsis opalescens]|uniref:Uncharacterized protein n=2 Tax=Allonocardiopsis opalescens TaxID=1144618 RepID=A0A2T0QF56_9ACTN|nr:hypothetical protein CLV72_1011161 [Allonocardiopsis opalescens]
MGYAAATPNGMYLYSNDCFTGYFAPQFPSDHDHHMVTCYEKYAEAGTREWAYNRWGLWTTADADLNVRTALIDYTLRSRPWQGTGARISRMNDYEPRSPSTQCNPGANVDVGFNGTGISIPIDNCEDVVVLPDTGARSMGVDYDPPFIRSGDQRALDFGMHVTARDTTTVPLYADYVWAEVMTCSIICSPENPSFSYVHTDSGW